MRLEWLYLLVLTGSLFWSVLLAGLSWFQGRRPHTDWLGLVLLSNTAILLTFFFFFVSRDAESAFFWVRLRLTLLDLTPLFFLGFALVYSQRLAWLRKPFYWGLYAMPILTAGVIWGAPQHFWMEWSVVHTHALNAENVVYGGWFWAHSAFVFAVLLVGCVLILRHGLRSTQQARHQSVVIVLAVMAPLLTVLAPVLGWSRGVLNPFPLGLAVGTFFFSWAMLKQGLLKVPALAYQSILGHMEDGVVLVDAQNRLVLFNEAARPCLAPAGQKLYPGQPLSVQGGDLAACWPGIQRRTLARWKSRARAKGRNTPLKCGFSGISQGRGQPDLRLFVLRDISARKAMEAALRQSAANLQAMLNSTWQSFTLIDRNYRVIDTDEKGKKVALAIFGKRLEAGVSIYDFVLPRDHASFTANFARAIQGETVVLEKDFPASEGRTLHFEFVYSPVVNDAGEVLGVCMSHQDITQRKQAQQRELDLRLEKARVQLLTTFMRDAAHEFRTPLAIISSSSHLLTRLDDPARREVKIEQVQAQVERIARLVDMLLTVVRLEGAEPLRYEKLDLATLVEGAVGACGARQAGSHLLAWQKPSQPCALCGDGAYVEEALAHLLDNACRFSPEGTRITVRVGAEAEQTWVEVLDEGSGISPEALPHVFELFWRQDNARTRPGFGLGLSIVQRIMARHGGQVTLESARAGDCVRPAFFRWRTPGYPQDSHHT
ncbi:MAG: PAS domain S-box protein, partial [Anaerolineae bacterium]|nr:PAS domain S-box protein [Anaerolineae bacterium]